MASSNKTKNGMALDKVMVLWSLSCNKYGVRRLPPPAGFIEVVRLDRS